jgi:hypothetical protein
VPRNYCSRRSSWSRYGDKCASVSTQVKSLYFVMMHLSSSLTEEPVVEFCSPGFILKPHFQNVFLSKYLIQSRHQSVTTPPYPPSTPPHQLFLTIGQSLVCDHHPITPS